MSLARPARRRFLTQSSRLGFGALLAAPVAQALQGAMQTAPAGRGTLDDIQHVVIFTQENRSFDHYFGTLSGVRGFADPVVQRQADGRDMFHQASDRHPDGVILPFHLDTRRSSGLCAQAPAMNYPVDLAIWNQGRMDAWNTARDPGLGMAHLTRADIPFYYALADAFTLCDQYYCSTLTQTNPNRLHLFSGGCGSGAGGRAVMDNDVPASGFEWSPLADQLDAAGVPWRVYQERNNFDDNAFAWFRAFREAAVGSERHRRGLAPVDDLVSAFAADVAADRLPAVSFIVAPDFLSEHASFRPGDGEDLTARLLLALFSRPEVYAKTLFILNYDEQGGWFDHLAPPMPPANRAEGLSTVPVDGEIVDGRPIGLGFRVPCLLVSPWTRGGWVTSEVCDHTSVIRLLERRFDFRCPNITPWRRAICGDLLTAFDFGAPEIGIPALPATLPFDAGRDAACRAMPEPQVPREQSLPRVEPGLRRSRALPYRFGVQARSIAGALQLRYDNDGPRGVVCTVHDRLRPTAAPRRHSLGGSSHLIEEVATASGVDLEVTAVNGFRRRFVHPAGTTGFAVVETADRREGRLRLALRSPTPITVTIIDRLRSAPPRELRIGLDGATTLEFDLVESGFWYDLVVASRDGGCRWEAGGRLECGIDSGSDPRRVA